ncbi:putative metal-dependent enzyme (double-stranded beta helix superfamily) [Methylobacterium brachiatum]|jgi:predicted metal-dependent enzyme (double-stranded beta helix superfamily)|uniref:Metal-dependent enzyme (Double-stranded beta helix superfamily) n=1 Tax=Methylobacterium brachiatum TaxID=269660 RepID=A0AAJ1TW19_9HYPH|nr:cysteine dioxygenase family protein [Methylobacterium brachiatum]MCB4804742.1 cysteine dioxygenase family protein [Methylobacterium brachiatum]MDQ0545784.1 putative metal-dependent enzyme (double-stranded beta helix superfamily) [Methylobacterium brachiatum]
MTPLTQPADVEAMMADLALSAESSADAYLASARATLLKILARPDLLDRTRLVAPPGGLGRNLLFGTRAISVWAMVWSPGAVTPVHDHHCSCCFGLLSGSLRETWYRPISDTHAVATLDAVRVPGYVACMMPTGPNLHRIANAGPDTAISIHVYGYDHREQASSIHRTYEVAPG